MSNKLGMLFRYKQHNLGRGSGGGGGQRARLLL